MVTHHEAKLAKWYRRCYPIAALIILAFEAWALFVQLSRWGLKVTEYSFIMIWIIAVVSALLLLIFRAKSHPAIAGLFCAVAVFSVLPMVGYHALPVTSQVNRLESLLLSQGILIGDTLIPAATVPELSVRESITDAVNFLAYAESAKHDQLKNKYPPRSMAPIVGTFQDMSLSLETPEVSVLLVFGNIDINVGTGSNQTYYWFNLNAIYLSEK